MSEWISVEDRLPPNTPKQVLAYTPGEGIDLACGDWLVDDLNYDLPIQATHWMPLPEPPK